MLASAEPASTGLLDEVGRLPLAGGDGTRQGIRVLDGRMALVGVNPAQEEVDAAPPTTLELRRLDRLSAPGERVPRLVSTRPRQASSVDLSRRWIVWSETPSTALAVDPWVLVGYDRDRQVTRQLASAPRMEDGTKPISVPGWTGPVLLGARVFWAQSAGTRAVPRVDVWGCEVDACQPAVVAAGAALPATNGRSLFVVSAPAYAGASDDAPYTIDRIDPDTSTRVPVSTITPTDGVVTWLAAGPGLLAWTTDGQPDRLVMHDLDAGTEQAIEADAASAGFGYPSVTGRAVLWTETGGAARDVGGYLYDRQTGRVWTLGNHAGLYGIGGDDDLVFWEESRTAQARPEDIDYVVGRLP